MWISPDDSSNLTKEQIREKIWKYSAGCRLPIKFENNVLFAWYSLCSVHYYFNPECDLCKAGYWRSENEIDKSEEWYKNHELNEKGDWVEKNA